MILDLYQVEDVHTGGGMGLVYRVRHLDWGISLAVKSPRPHYFRSERQKQSFVNECDTWIKLGLHPHTVSCYYVRSLGGIPRVFAEYVEGGSLSDWVRSGRFYADGPERSLERALDVGIQCAWGLQHAHDHPGCLVHRDVKPANVLMTPDGMAKVTDFGLAKAATELSADAARGADGLTRAYCSPEQAQKGLLDLRTDIWSWGLTVLEIFTGGLIWLVGQAAAETLAAFLDGEIEEPGIAEMPPPLADLLKHCFEIDPSARPADMRAVTKEMRGIYREVTGSDYARHEPRAADHRAEGLNNTAVSFLDLGRRRDAEAAFERALASDPQHPEASYNQGLVKWRTGRMTDSALVRRLEDIRVAHPEQWRTAYLLGLVHMERGDAESAVSVLEEAALHSLCTGRFPRRRRA